MQARIANSRPGGTGRDAGTAPQPRPDAAPVPTGFSHLPPLDGLRAIAILLVFVAHCGLERIVPGGLGVTLFFFLSGYLITSLLRSERERTGRVDLPAFFVRRTLRIWPPLYLTLALALGLALLIGPPHPIDPWAVAAQAAFLGNYWWGGTASVPAMPLWSLAVEEHFYLLFPVLFALCARRMRPARLAGACAALCVLVLAVRLWLVGRVPDPGQLYYWSHTRIDSILFGCCLALWQNPVLDRDPWRPRGGHVGAALAVLLLCLVLRDEVFRQTWRYSLQGVALFVLFSAALQSRGWPARWLGSAPLRIVARHSYTFYLAHMFVLDELVGGLPVPLRAVTGGAIAFGYAALMRRWVERPLGRARTALHAADKGAVPAG